MIALGELLHMYIKQSGYTVYSIAYSSKINRTTLQKALSGERPLSRSNLDKLIPFLKLTPEEHKTLEKAYTIASLGEATYRKHYYIKELVENIKIYDQDTDDTLLTTAPPQPLRLEKATNIKGMYNILSTVKRLADALIEDFDTPYLHVISKFSGSFFVSLYNQLRHSYYKALEIKHIIPFVKNTDIRSGSLLYNLEELSSLLPFSLSVQTNCSFHYFYEVDNIASFSSFPYSSYILLNHNVVLISSDYQDALILPEACTSNFRNNFSDILKISSLLLETINNPSLLFFATEDLTNSHFSHSIDMQPCIFYFINSDISYNVMNGGQIPQEYRKPIADLIDKRRIELNQLSESCMIFPYQGFQDFVEKGIIYEVPAEMGRPLNKEERISILKQIIEMNNEGIHKFFLLKKDGFQPKLYVLTYDASSIVFYYKKSDYDYQICSLYEPSIIHEMNDFISNAANHDFSYSLIESNEIFEQTILQLEAAPVENKQAFTPPPKNY
ncbi:MAG: hypothetical protein ACI4DW_02670 [Lachnospiraceae bacterium]